jgi:hypothetical protein
MIGLWGVGVGLGRWARPLWGTPHRAGRGVRARDDGVGASPTFKPARAPRRRAAIRAERGPATRNAAKTFGIAARERYPPPRPRGRRDSGAKHRRIARSVAGPSASPAGEGAGLSVGACASVASSSVPRPRRPARRHRLQRWSLLRLRAGVARQPPRTARARLAIQHAPPCASVITTPCCGTAAAAQRAGLVATPSPPAKAAWAVPRGQCKLLASAPGRPPALRSGPQRACNRR